MKAICYENTRTTLPNFIGNLHYNQPFGYAYETDTYFIHFYGAKEPFYTISTGLTVVEAKKNITLLEWVNKTFGAKNIKSMNFPVGNVMKSVWRPGLYFYDEIKQALNYNDSFLLHSNQSLIILLQKLSDLLLYIQPTKRSVKTYSHKIRELLLLSATEFENQCSSLLREWNIPPIGKFYTTNDFIKIKKYVKLSEYNVIYKIFEPREKYHPFNKWSKKNPTGSLKWYDSYNKTKHNNDLDFDKATLDAVLNSIASNIIMSIIRFGPFMLINGNDLLSTYTNQLLELEMKNADNKSFYLPLVKIPLGSRSDLFLFEPHNENLVQKWKVTKNFFK